MLAVAVVLGHAPLATLHLRSLWQHEQYQYFPFVIGAVILLLVTRWRAAGPPSSVPRWRALPCALLGTAGLLLSGAILLVSGWLAFVSLNVALGAVFVWLGRRRAIANLGGLWCLLWLMVPPPLRVDQIIVERLQSLSSQLSSMILDATSILHVMSGNVLVMPSKELFVDEACSGIISVMSIVACSMIYAVWRDRTVVHVVLLTLCGVFWAVVMNVARIYLIAVAESRWQWDLTSGTPHELISLVIFLATFSALISTDHLLVGMLAPISWSSIGDQQYGRRLASAWNAWAATGISGRRLREVEPASGYAADFRSRVGPPMAAATCTGFLLLGLIQLTWLPSPDTPEADRAVDRALAIGEQALPKRIGRWELDKFESQEREAFSDFGRYSRSFTYRHLDRPDAQVNVSLDFPYIGGWHDLCMCYRGAGWTTEERNIVAEEWPFVAASLHRSDGRAQVLFTGFDVSGAVAEPPSAAVLFRPWFRLRRRLLHQLAPQLFQVQVFAAGDFEDNEQMRAELKELLFAARQRFRERVVSGEGERQTDRR